MTVRLRGHHLLCLLTYKGLGYGPAFTANLDRIAMRLNTGEPVVLVEGPDDVCAPLHAAGDPHCTRPGVHGRDRQALDAVARLLGHPLAPGATLGLEAAAVARLRHAFADGAIRAACGGCEWHGLCTAVAAAGYPETRLRPGGMAGFSGPSRRRPGC